MAKSKEPKTLEQLRQALRELIDPAEDVRVEAKKFVVTTQALHSRTVTMFYCGEINWRLPEHRGGFLCLSETGPTLTEVYRDCRLALARELEERGRLRRIASAPASGRPALLVVDDPQWDERITKAALPAPSPRRLEYQP